MGVSIRAYARHRGISDTAVHKALKTGRITAEPDGSIDIDRANHDWQLNTAQREKQSSPQLGREASDPSRGDSSQGDPSQAHEQQGEFSSGRTTYTQAKTANEVLKAHTNRVRLKQLKGEVIDRNEAIAHVFRLARQERDLWQTWPSRVSSQMAAELEVDAHKLHVTLGRYIREQLEEVALVEPTFKS